MGATSTRRSSSKGRRARVSAVEAVESHGRWPLLSQCPHDPAAAARARVLVSQGWGPLRGWLEADGLQQGGTAPGIEATLPTAAAPRSAH